jgi:acyl carrier protein
MDDRTIEVEIRSFLTENFPLAGDLSGIPSDGSLIGLGIVDSTGVLEIVGFIEARFSFEVPTAELLPENLDSIDNLTRYVRTKMGETGADGRG